MTDRDVYLKLKALAEELAALAEACDSAVGNAALVSSAQTLNGTADVIYQHCLTDEDLH